MRSNHERTVANAFDNISILRDTPDVGLLYSGGLDSYILACMLPYAGLMVFESEPWSEACLRPDYERFASRLDRVGFELPLLCHSQESSIVFNRNTHYALVAATKFNHVVLGGNLSDCGSDKDEEWARLVNALLEHTCAYPHMRVIQANNQIPQVVVPCSEITKTDMVELYLKLGFPAGDLLAESTSCDVNPGVDSQCGLCIGCFTKACVLSQFDLGLNDLAGSFLRSPFDISPEEFEHNMEIVTKFRWNLGLSELYKAQKYIGLRSIVAAKTEAKSQGSSPAKADKVAPKGATGKNGKAHKKARLVRKP